MYRRPRFLEVLHSIREEMSREADYDVDLFAEMVRSGVRPAHGPQRVIRGFRTRFGELRKSECADRHDQVANCDIEVVPGRDEISGDGGEPCGHDVSTEPRPREHEDAGHDLDHADDHHERRERQVTEQRARILLPIDEQVRELVGARDDRDQAVGEAQHLPRGVELFRHAQ